MTSLLTLGMQPLLTFFLAQSRFPIESLAVLPVVHSLVFVFRSSGLAFQEVVIVLVGSGRENLPPLRRFAKTLGWVSTAALGVLAFSPLARLWLGSVAGLADELSAFAFAPLQILCLMPALEVLLSWQRSLLVVARRTGLVTWGTAVEIGAALAVLAIAIGTFDMVGVTAAALAIVAARLAANGFLAWRLATS